MKYFIENGANLNSKNVNGWTALILASEDTHLQIVKYLVEMELKLKQKIKMERQY